MAPLAISVVKLLALVGGSTTMSSTESMYVCSFHGAYSNWPILFTFVLPTAGATSIPIRTHLALTTKV
ncbi:uncharacterized protein N7479_009338 [Penicillium vulpinum]|uniref:uncharacterized protein n=1 Tax=Penicillium vulpinum TaxID=29845 RepID=UPI0025471C05|nr:uncharacterized protein N7479_009338 [Penicillium vulpinum]KAJ5950925.1 hypothetical protein N7479_009338 [Penicillium vulpinum]